MAESTQHKLDRIRSPRVQITYDVEIGNAIEMKELPFVVGILADLSGMITDPLPLVKERKFVEIDNDSFEEIMSSIRPRLAFSVDNKLGGDAEHLGVELFFQNMDDFGPLNVLKQVEPLSKLYDSRSLLKDLLTKLDGNDHLEEGLQELITTPDKLKLITDQLASDAGGDDLNKLLVDGKLMRDDSQKPFAINMLKEFVNQLSQTADADKPKYATAFIQSKIQKIDELLNDQLNEIIHYPEFLKLEGSWRSLNYLVMNTNCGPKLKLRLLNITKQELLKDLEKAVEFDQSQLFKKVYEEEYGTFGGHPYSCLVGDYQFGRHPQDIELLEKIASVAAAAHAPFIAAADPKLFDLDSFEHIGVPRDLSKIFESVELVKWNGFRSSEDSRYASLTLPRVLMRLPYGSNTLPVEGMNFEETVSGTDSSKFCWGNPAFVLGQRITNAFSLYGWTAAIRGVEGGGIVEDLPSYTFKTSDGDIVLKCPTEVAITDRREKELSDLGFISICHCKGTDYAAFFGGQTTQKPKVYNLDDANANSNLSARLPYMLAASRFAHYIKVIMRDKIGSFLTKDNVALYLNTWIANYVLLNDDASQSVKAQYPLREARIDVFDVPGKPGSYKSVVYLRPHFQMEELTASIRLVATLPPPAK
jgi:type VI secretion system protein ImpC